MSYVGASKRCAAWLSLCLLVVLSHTVLSACMVWQSYYAAVLGCDPLTTGKHLAVTGIVRFVGNFLGATLETTLQKLGFKQLDIRKRVCLVNNTLQAGFCLGFGLSRTPMLATIMNCGVCLCDCFQGIGFSQNYYEVGGEDTAILTSVGNVFASFGELCLALHHFGANDFAWTLHNPQYFVAASRLVDQTMPVMIVRVVGGMVAPPLGSWLQAATGQWYPLYAISAAIHLFAGCFFFACASDTPARILLHRCKTDRP